MLLSMLMLSFPALCNILGIFLVVLLVYSLLAMQERRVCVTAKACMLLVCSLLAA